MLPRSGVEVLLVEQPLEEPRDDPRTRHLPGTALTSPATCHGRGSHDCHRTLKGKSADRLLRRGRLNAPLRVLILAGQHGDERSARRALQSLLARPPQEVADCLPAIKL